MPTPRRLLLGTLAILLLFGATLGYGAGGAMERRSLRDLKRVAVVILVKDAYREARPVLRAALTESLAGHGIEVVAEGERPEAVVRYDLKIIEPVTRSREKIGLFVLVSRLEVLQPCVLKRLPETTVLAPTWSAESLFSGPADSLDQALAADANEKTDLFGRDLGGGEAE